jgi:hypothetical protein
MDGTMAAIITGTVLLIALFLILNTSNGGAFATVFNSIGGNYANVVKVLMGRA